eukprot:365590-Chlamydomonas_euryale.AAC.5
MPTPTLTLLHSDTPALSKLQVTELCYSPDGRWLFSAGKDANLCVYDVASCYAPVKFLSAGSKMPRVSCCWRGCSVEGGG